MKNTIIIIIGLCLLSGTLSAQEKMAYINGLPVYRQLEPEGTQVEETEGINFLATSYASLWENYRVNDYENNSLWENLWQLMPREEIKGDLFQTPCRTTNLAQIALLIDVTGSMAAELEAIRHLWPDLIYDLQNHQRDLRWQTASLFFRDEPLGRKMPMEDFQNNLYKTNQALNEIRAGGGGEAAEAWPQALAMALDSLSWTQKATQMLVLVIDAVPSFSVEAAEQLKAIIELAKTKNVRISPITGLDADEELMYLAKSIAWSTGGILLEMKKDQVMASSKIIAGELNTLIGISCLQKEQQLTSASKIACFPNPARNETFLNMPETSSRIRVLDANGRVVKELGQTKASSVRLDVKNWPAGVYIIEVQLGDRLEKVRFVKE